MRLLGNSRATERILLFRNIFDTKIGGSIQYYIWYDLLVSQRIAIVTSCLVVPTTKDFDWPKTQRKALKQLSQIKQTMHPEKRKKLLGQLKRKKTSTQHRTASVHNFRLFHNDKKSALPRISYLKAQKINQSSRGKHHPACTSLADNH